MLVKNVIILNISWIIICINHYLKIRLNICFFFVWTRVKGKYNLINSSISAGLLFSILINYNSSIFFKKHLKSWPIIKSVWMHSATKLKGERQKLWQPCTFKNHNATKQIILHILLSLTHRTSRSHRLPVDSLATNKPCNTIKQKIV